MKGYGSAKTAQLLSMYPLTEYFLNSGVTVNAMHPADVTTNMGENNGRIYRFFKHNSETMGNIESQRQRVMAGRGGDSVFTLYLGVDTPAEEFAAVTRGHLFYTPSRQGLGDTHRGRLADLLRSSKQDNRDDILNWLENYSRLTTCEISIPSLRDAGLSPAGKTGMIISFLLEYDLVRKVFDQNWYDGFKRHVEDAMIDVLDASVFPGIKERICLRFSSSPLTIERRFSNSEGGITGWTFEQAAPVINNLREMPKAVKTPFPDVLQAGQWAYSPAGIPTAILTGWYAYSAIKRRGRISPESIPEGDN